MHGSEGDTCGSSDVRQAIERSWVRFLDILLSYNAEHSVEWYPVRPRIAFQTATLVWKYVCGVASAYLHELCVPAEYVRVRLRSRSASTRCVHLSRKTPRTAKYCILWTHSIEQSAICSAWQYGLTLNASRRRLNGERLSFLTTMNTSRYRCGVAAIPAPSTNVMTYPLTYLLTYLLRKLASCSHTHVPVNKQCSLVLAERRRRRATMSNTGPSLYVLENHAILQSLWIP